LNISGSQLFKEALEGQRKFLGPEHASALVTMTRLARMYEGQAEYEKAEALYANVLEIRTRTLGRAHVDTAGALESIGRLRLKQKKYGEAVSLLKECLTIWVKTNPDAFDRFETESLLGASLAAQGIYVEAEPLLLSGYEGLSKRETIMPFDQRSSVSESGQRIIELYNAWHKPSKATEWRERLAPLGTANTLIPERKH
jgi:non-specific serine/threonine protein kinase/serine/threonine-protein kinase